MDIRHILVYLKQCFARSMGYFSYLTAFLLITANIKLFESQINDIGITISQAILLASFIFFIGSFIMGSIDLKYGIWRQENDFVWNVTPMAKELCDRTKRIEEKIDNK